MEGIYCDTLDGGLAFALSLVPVGSTVSWSGSQTIDQIGLKPLLRKAPCTVIDRDQASDEESLLVLNRKAMASDVFFMGSNAITLDGKLVNMDCNGIGPAALVFGPKTVVVIAGMNKITPDEETAIARVRKQRAPIDNMRLQRNTPCATTGLCFNCLEEGCLCSNLIITRRCSVRGRIKVILIGADLGF
jgi:hypothetical protein